MRARDILLLSALLIPPAGCSADRPRQRRLPEAFAVPPADGNANSDPERRILSDQMRRMAEEDVASVRR